MARGMKDPELGQALRELTGEEDLAVRGPAAEVMGYEVAYQGKRLLINWELFCRATHGGDALKALAKEVQAQGHKAEKDPVFRERIIAERVAWGEITGSLPKGELFSEKFKPLYEGHPLFRERAKERCAFLMTLAQQVELIHLYAEAFKGYREHMACLMDELKLRRQRKLETEREFLDRAKRLRVGTPEEISVSERILEQHERFWEYAEKMGLTYANSVMRGKADDHLTHVRLHNELERKRQQAEKDHAAMCERMEPKVPRGEPANALTPLKDAADAIHMKDQEWREKVDRLIREGKSLEEVLTEGRPGSLEELLPPKPLLFPPLPPKEPSGDAEPLPGPLDLEAHRPGRIEPPEAELATEGHSRAPEGHVTPAGKNPHWPDVCPQCGSPAWANGFKTECSNTECENS